MYTPSFRDLAKLLASNPGLCSNGWTVGGGPYSSKPREAEVEFSILWAGVYLVPYTIKTVNPSADSYHLKHLAEHQSGVYVTNGAFIAALMLWKIPGKFDRLNPTFAISERRRKELQRLRCATQHAAGISPEEWLKGNR